MTDAYEINRDPLPLYAERAEGATPGLKPCDGIRVAFLGRRGGDGPLTIGQASTLEWVSNASLYTRMMEWPLPLPAGTTLEDIAAAVEILMARHESLRTTYPAGGEPIQRVALSGEMLIDVYEATEEPADDWVLTMELARRLRSREFDLTADLPVRMAVACRQSAPRVAVAMYSHMAVDFASMALLHRQFMSLVSDPASREVGPPAHQPLDQAADERTERGRRRTRAALETWDRHLRVMPQCLYAVPQTGQQRGGRVSGWLWSRAAALALPHIAVRTGASSQMVVFAALCAVLGWRTGHERCVLPVAASNRYQAHLREYVGSLAQDCIIAVDLRGRSLDEVVRRTMAAVLRGNKSGQVEIPPLVRVVQRVQHDRGIVYGRYCVYNDLSTLLGDTRAPVPGPDPEQAAHALGKTRFASLDSPPVEELLLVQLQQVDGELIIGGMTRDAGRVPLDEIEVLLRGLESLLVAAAPGDPDLSRLAEITGCRPIARGPGWLRVDGSWVQLSEAQRLVDDALGVPSAVFAVPGPRGEPLLVGYLAAGNGISTPQQAHEACLEAFTGNSSGEHSAGIRYSAMTPGRYVICDGTPQDRRDLAAWRRRPVLAHGDGRSG